MTLMRSSIWILGVLLLGHASISQAKGDLDPILVHVERRLDEESSTDAGEPNAVTFERAMGTAPVRAVVAKGADIERTLTLPECLKRSFENNNDIKQVREGIIAMGGSRLIANSRFLPTIELISQYEHVKDFESDVGREDAFSVSAKFSQRLLEYGKDNPIDVSLRAEQRDALFQYENTVAATFSQVRRAFYFVLLKDRQIATRRQSLEQFQKQYDKKRQRMEAGNLSVKIEVLTARLNVLNEQTRINTLERQKFNEEMDLLRLVGLPVGADAVEFAGEADAFGLNSFDIDAMIGLALAQSSDVALAEALVAERQRTLDQLRYEFLPDVRGTAGYQDENGRMGVDLSNQDDTWGLDVFGQPLLPGQRADRAAGLGLFGTETSLRGPDPGWFGGVQLRIPVYEGRSREGRRIWNRAFLQSAKAALDDRKDEIELFVRQRYKLLSEQVFQVELAQENVNIERERFSIQEQLRDVGRIDDDALERFRENFFRTQDGLFGEQEQLIQRQEDLRLTVRYFK
jgi:outer membrane protein TolC